MDRQDGDTFTAPEVSETPLPRLGEVNAERIENTAVKGAIARLQARAKPIHASHYTKHSSHSTHSKGNW